MACSSGRSCRDCISGAATLPTIRIHLPASTGCRHSHSPEPAPAPRVCVCVCVCVYVCVCVCVHALTHALSHVRLFCDPMDCSPQGSSVHGILQARILEWVAISFSRDLPDPGIIPVSPALAGGFFLLLSHLGSPLQSLTPYQLTRHLLWIQPPRLPTAQAQAKMGHFSLE